MRLGGKRALVTGGSDGIGLAITEAFLREGAEVLIVGRDARKLDAAREKLGAGVETLSADLATSAGIDAVVERVKKSSRPLDVLVNNAGVAFLVAFETVSQEQFQQSFALNVTAAFFLTQRLLPHLTPSGASVINISSYFANKMIPKRPSSLYSLSKGRAQFADQVAGLRTRSARHQGQCHRPRHGRHRDAAQIDRKPAGGSTDRAESLCRAQLPARPHRPDQRPRRHRGISQATRRRGRVAGFLPSTAGYTAG